MFGRVKMKRVADGEETAVLIPVVVAPVQVEVALRAVPVEVGHVAVAVRIDPGRAVKCGICRLCHCLPIARHGCILFGDVIPLTYSTKYFHGITVTALYGKPWPLVFLAYRSVQISIAQSRSRGLNHLLSK